MANSALAIFYAIISYSMLNIGLCLQKKGAASLPNIEGESLVANIKNFLSNREWIIGFTLTCVQWIFYAMAIDLGSLSLVTPMIGIGLVVLVVFSYFYLKEPISKPIIIGIVGITIGAIILGLTNPNEEPTYTLAQINALFTEFPSILFIILTLAGTAVPIVISISRGFKNADVIFGLASGVFGGLGGILSKGLMGGIDMGDPIGSILVSIGVFSWWLYAIGTIVSNTTSMILQQFGYQKGKAVIVAPLFSVMGVIYPVFGGIVIFSEWGELDTSLIALKIVAIMIILIGVAILSFYSTKYEVEEELIDAGVEDG